MIRPHLVAASAAVLLPLAACGKKGPPLAPLRSVPGQVTEVAGRRAGSDMQIRFTLPTQNAGGTERIDLERLEVYAITVGPGGVVPPARDLLTAKYLVKTVAVKPPPVETEEGVEEAPAGDKPQDKDTRPLPGERVTFVESLTEAQLKPVITVRPSAAPKAAATTTPAGPPALDPAVPTRYYVLRGRSRRGDAGGPVRVALPLVAPPTAPTELRASSTEKAVTFEWTAPPATIDPVAAAINEHGWATVNAPIPPLPATAQRSRPPATDPSAPPVDPGVLVPLTRLPGVVLPTIVLPAAPRYNVYAVKGGAVEDKPLNTAPIAVSSFSTGEPAWNEELCLIVRTVRTYGLVSVESDAAGPACITPRDTFAPAAPTGLRAVAIPGAMNLTWDANKEPDLAGYLVLRGEAPGATLQALTPAPIRETSFRDTTVTSGVRYVYAIVAVDKATTPNMSPQSARQEEMAR